MRYCSNPSCKAELLKRHQLKYCSNQCQQDHGFRKYVKMWKQGEATGNRGIVTKNLSGHLKRYIKEKFGEKCSQCGWDIKHPMTGSVPLEIDHIDGNSENNTEANLRLLCPNCHALTVSFKNLNKGKGRKWRKVKYLKSK